MIIDVIGDIHGYADKLVGLLKQLGYVHNGQYFVPPEGHRALFIGDLMDRGPQQVATLEIVFAMLDADVADAVMGNHEYNALAFATPDPDAPGEYLRSHDTVHTRQHEAFLAEVPFGSAAHQYWLKRFYEIPLWLETDYACFVHACWDVDSMAVLKPLLTADNCLTPHALEVTSREFSTAFDALERVLKGVETPLPDGLVMVDKEGTERKRVRVRWWLDALNQRTLYEVARAPASALAQIPQDVLADNIDFALKTHKPVFVGHYWLTGTPEPLSAQVACTDYSAAVDSGYLTCYQLDTTKPLPLTADNFVQYRHDQH
ncbi:MULTISPECIES: metallophosphoesterase [Psychrobacter]|uniref:Metallophosphoesterase n=1 Tax=Psychrobacter halodurans TaxID=2818439 RepID=A0AAW4IRQ1_9GAMM|nr:MULTISPECIES: metallophosphoesterase [Psychrobacter]MBO1517836.1 metallophosphoesterase [Psychrobacter halodurans]PJX27298.1 phosphoesterase [Psychrobacter sp. L7]